MINIETLFPIASVEDNCILSKTGAITLAYRLQLPAMFSLEEKEYDALHQTWIKAIRLLPKHTVLHKQDWFIKRRVEAGPAGTFLSAASDRFFCGRPYLDHESYLFLSMKPPGRSAFCQLLRPRLVPKQALDPRFLHHFEEIAGQFIQVLQDSGFIQAIRLEDEALAGREDTAGLLERYCLLLPGKQTPCLSDMQVRPDMRIGHKHCKLYTLADTADLPGMCGSRMTYDPYSTDRTQVSIGFAGSLGLLLDCDHLYNQYLFIEDAQKTIKQLERKRLRLNALSAYSRENALSRDGVETYLQDALAHQYLPLKAHFNVLVWAEEEKKLKEVCQQVSAHMAKMDAVAKQETLGAPQIFWAGIPGNAPDFPENDTFITFAEQASCFLNLESNERSDTRGLRLNERLYGRPVLVDLFDGPMQAGKITNRNLFVCGGSGGGKSMLMNHLLRTQYEAGVHCVVIDVGGSYKGLCALLNGYYFIYTEANPLRFNPFFLEEGEALDTEKKESLKTLLFALWKKSEESYTRSEYVALSNALTHYYQKLQTCPECFPCFNSFYEFLQQDYRKLLQDASVHPRDFDFENFLYVLQPYYKGGEFDYLLNARENLDLLKERFIVFELDNIKNHEILFPVVTIIIMQMFIAKMRKLEGRKILAIDEAWIPIARAGMAGFIKYLYKTIRKFNGIPALITQEVDDLISSPIIKETVVNLSDTKIFLDMRKFINKFDQLQETLGLSEKARTLLLSLNLANDPDMTYRELLIDQGGQSVKVYRNILSPQEYYAYTTELSEKLQVEAYARRYGTMQEGITRLVQEQSHENKDKANQSENP